MMSISIVILNWNAAADTIRCVRQMAAWQRLQPIIWVVDNASTDGSADLIARECPQVKLIPNPANLGFAGGTNRGLEQALAVGDAPILLLNNDASVAEAEVIRLIDTLQTDNRIGFIGPCLYDAENPERLLSAGGKNPVLHHHSHMAAPPTDEPVYPVMCVPGTVILVRAEVFHQVGWLDEAYFFGTEVADLCMQAKRQRGYLSFIDTRARAYHTLSRSSRFRETLYVYYIIRNRYLFIRKHHRWHLWLYAFWILYGAALALKLRLNGKGHTAQAVYLGTLDGLQGRFGNQNERVLALVNQQPANLSTSSLTADP